MQECGESWQELARKRRSLKVSKNQKYKSGGKVDGEKGSKSLGKHKRGAGVPDDESEQEIKKLGKNQDDQKTSWDGYKDGGAPKKKWIQGAIKHPGAEKRAAARAGKSTHEYMEEHKHDSGTAGRRARLGLALSKMNKK